MTKPATLAAARSAKEEATRQLADRTDVVGIGLTRIKRGGYAVKVNLSRAPAKAMPQSVQGVPLLVDVVGTIRKRS